MSATQFASRNERFMAGRLIDSRPLDDSRDSPVCCFTCGPAHFHGSNRLHRPAPPTCSQIHGPRDDSGKFLFLKTRKRRSSRSNEQVFQLTDKNQMRNIPAARGVAVERERLSTDRLACRSIERTNRSAMIVSSYYFFIPSRPNVNRSKYRSARWPAGKQTLVSLY
jgi:hypothetical protein